ncbi:Putative peptidoglycan binding domain-containing protein [Lishizhenia tianjinensis]|uniref:Putative peptidoglycan binding domain-containing protein n=1 Tax=Lishizhenia tianjinensis TaxID=477690 RepID=A0A1I6Y5R6_9FLAO|nr:L,D-transpeptidase family protein [Lishizhenia tianjinensis]SFT45945.1 Putative peptidoglycan binding domain-containing protein [Lishizhenia tianjinensis]
MRNLLLYTAVFILLVGCNSPSSKPEELPIEQERFEQQLKASNFKQLKLDPAQFKFLNTFYAANDYQRFWVNDSLLLPDGDTLQHLLNNYYYFCTPLNRYKELPSFHDLDLIEQENLITLKLAYLLNDLKEGFIDTVQKQIKPLSPLSPDHLSKFIKEEKIGTWEQNILRHSTPHENFTKTLEGINAFVKTYKLDTIAYKISSAKEDSIQSKQEAKLALYTKGFTDGPEIDDSIYTLALMKFQTMNGLEADGVLGKNTVEALNESNASKYNRTVLALDKWRWKDSLPDKYIWVNIPAYELSLYINDSLKRQHRVVVGTRFNRTPQFTADMKTIVAYPFWHVPYSISSKEILPHLKKDSNYLAKNNYKIFKDGSRVDASQVDWSKIGRNSFPYSVRQDGGSYNSLGLVKLLFPNEHSVYIHDTPSKKFFDKAVRSYSHGCIRCQNPLELAGYILERDTNVYNRDSLDVLIARRTQKTIPLNHPFPVFVDYISVGTDSNDAIVFYLNVYNKDEEWLRLLK